MSVYFFQDVSRIHRRTHRHTDALRHAFLSYKKSRNETESVINHFGNKFACAGKSSGTAPGWQVLQDGFTGMEQGNKMKDWEKAGAQQDDLHGEVKDQENSDEDFADW